MHKISERLFIGNSDCALNFEYLEAQNVSLIVCAARGMFANAFRT